MSELPRRIDINIASVPIKGVGGFFLCLTAIIGLVSIPQGRWFFVAALTSGALLASALILYRSWRRRNAATRAKTLSL